MSPAAARFALHQARPGQRRAGRAPGPALRQPRRPRTMASALSQHPRNRLPVAMHHRRALPPLQVPSGRPNPEAQVGVAPRPHPRLEPPHLLERLSPHGRVGGLRKRPLVMGKRDLLAHRRLQPRVARGGGGRVLRRLLVDDSARQDPDPPARRRLEVPREQVRRRKHVRVQEHQPLRAALRCRSIASVIRRLPLTGAQHPHTADPVRVASPRPVIRDGHAVPRLQIKPRQPLEHESKPRIRPPKRKHDINRRPPAHSPNLCRRSSRPPRLPILAVPQGA